MADCRLSLQNASATSGMLKIRSRLMLLNLPFVAHSNARRMSATLCWRPSRFRLASQNDCAPMLILLNPILQKSAYRILSFSPGFASIVISAPSRMP